MEGCFEKKSAKDIENGESERSLQAAPALEDISYEVAKVLRRRRWEVREEPFLGFGSPPGRF